MKITTLRDMAHHAYDLCCIAESVRFTSDTLLMTINGQSHDIIWFDCLNTYHYFKGRELVMVFQDMNLQVSDTEVSITMSNDDVSLCLVFGKHGM